MINPNDAVSFRKVTLKDLVDDAVARKDKAALEWLKAESEKKIERKRGEKVSIVSKPVTGIRSEYAIKFLGFTKKTKNSTATRQQKIEQERKLMFDEAFAKIKG